MASISRESGNDSEMHVSFEDQQKINKFACQNARLDDVVEELKVKEGFNGFNRTRHSRSLSCPEYVRLIPKEKSKSAVWMYFGLPVNEEGQLVSDQLAICKLCNCPSSCIKGSTSNLASHLKLYHPSAFREVQSKSQPWAFREKSESQESASVIKRKSCSPIVVSVASLAAPENVATSDVMESPSAKKQKLLNYNQHSDLNTTTICTNAITKFIAVTMQSYSIVESESFVEMVKVLNPQYHLPGTKFFSHIAVPKLYEVTKSNIASALSAIKGNDISITTDCWTLISNVPFISVTAHFIDPGWNLVSACLSCTQLDKDPVSNVPEVLREVLSSWNLNIDELGSWTMDTEAKVLKDIPLLKEQIVPCFGHAINAAINRALQIPTLQRAIGKLQKILSTISRSWNERRDLCKTQEALQVYAISLPSASSVRWWSILSLCSKFLQNQLQINKLLQELTSTCDLMLEEGEISTLDDLVSVTKLFVDIRKNLSGEEYVTASSVVPLLSKIWNYVQIKETDKKLVKSIKERIFSVLKERYYENEDVMSTLWLCSFCDPRFRLKYAENPDKVRNLVLACMTEIYDADANNYLDAFDGAVVQKKPKRGLSLILENDDVDEENAMSSRKRAENELNNYMVMPKVEIDASPFTWWKDHEQSFPILKVLSKKFLAFQGSSVPLENVFCTGSFIINRRKSFLYPKNAEKSVFLSQNKLFI